jgi:capsular polysaccharide biosynthesis protein
MELREYWSIIRRRWWIPAVITVVALVASTFVAVRGATAYRTDMRLAVSTIPTPDPNGTLYYDPTYYANLDSEYLADDMSEFMTSRAFADEVHRELASGSTPMDVDINSIMSSTRAKKTHRFIDITLTTPTLEQGQAIAGSISRILSDPNHVSQYLTALTAYHTQMEIVTPPVTGRANTPLGIASEVGLRTLIGLLVGIGLVFLIDYLDPSVRTREEAERLLEMPVLGEIPKPARGRAVFRRGATA